MTRTPTSLSFTTVVQILDPDGGLRTPSRGKTVHCSVTWTPLTHNPPVLTVGRRGYPDLDHGPHTRHRHENVTKKVCDFRISSGSSRSSSSSEEEEEGGIIPVRVLWVKESSETTPIIFMKRIFG